MKKKLLIITASLSLILVACGATYLKTPMISENTNTTFSIIEKCEVNKNLDSYIIVDNDTKVMYALFISDGSYSRGNTSFSPLLNPDGSIRLYK